MTAATRRQIVRRGICCEVSPPRYGALFHDLYVKSQGRIYFRYIACRKLKLSFVNKNYGRLLTRFFDKSCITQCTELCTKSWTRSINVLGHVSKLHANYSCFIWVIDMQFSQGTMTVCFRSALTFNDYQRWWTPGRSDSIISLLSRMLSAIWCVPNVHCMQSS